MPFSETWGGMEAVLSLGLAKAIGVSNFSCALVMDLLKTCKGVEHNFSAWFCCNQCGAVPPAVNQVEMHPYLTQTTFLSFMCASSLFVPCLYALL